MFVQVGRFMRRAITFAIVAMMMLGSLVAPTSTMAQAQTLQSTLTGVTIAYQAPYQLYEDGQYADDAMETMMFVGPADILAMGFMSPLIDINGARDIMLESLFGEMGTASTIDRGDYTGVSYSLDMLNFDGQEMGVFSLFMNQRPHGYAEFYIFLAPPTLFGTSMQTVQNSFTIDGTPLMDGVDPIVMGDMVTANIGITGGEAVTDVTEVTETDNTGTDTPETDTTTPSGDTTAEGDGLTYLLSVMLEYSAVDNSILTILETLQAFGEEEMTAEQAFDIITEQSRFLSGVNDRVAQIPVPADMQGFHQETLNWASSVTAIGTTWIAFVEGTGTDTAATSALETGVTTHIEFGESLQGQQVSIETSPDSTDAGDSTGATEVAQPDTGAGDAATYIEAVQGHRADFAMSLGSFNDSLNMLEGEPTDAEVQAAFDGTLVEAEKWAAYSATAQQLTPPPGYEGVHDAYLEWAGHVTEIGNIWIAALNGQDGQIDAFFDYLPLVQQADNDLQDAITAAGSGDAGSSATTDDSAATETPSRTTRTSSSTEDDEVDNSSETTGRTTRSTGTTDDEGEDTGDSTSGTSRTTRSTGTADDEEEDTSDSTSGTSRTSRTSGTSDDTEDEDTSGNTSETSGRTSRSERGGTDPDTDSSDDTVSDLPNEWLAEANGVSITWSDDLSLTEGADEAQSSDSATGEDTIILQAETTDGTSAPVWITVTQNSSGDSTGLISTLVDDPDAAADIWGPGTEVHDSNVTAGASAVLMHAEDEIGGYWIYLQATCLEPECETLILLEIAVEGAPLVETLEIAQTGLAVDGVPVSVALPVGDVETVVEQIGD